MGRDRKAENKRSTELFCSGEIESIPEAWARATYEARAPQRRNRRARLKAKAERKRRKRDRKRNRGK
jgi:hypothetical protein